MTPGNRFKTLPELLKLSAQTLQEEVR